MVNPNYATGRVATGARVAEIDEGLRAYMNKVYALMAGAMVITGLVAWVIGHDFREAIVASQGGDAAPYILGPGAIATLYGSPLKWVIMFAPLAFVFGFAAMINRMSASAAQMTFWAFGAVMGLSMAWIFAVFTGESIARTFFITAIAFGGLSIWGYTTRKDLSGWGSFLIMGVIGLIVASIVNIFLASSGLQWAISLIGVLLFAGLTAYDTQSIKNEYLGMRATPGGEAWLEKGAIMGALRLYLDFINMFMFLLQFLGNRE
ncbi:Bax inhibitor-1/YccA family protein [Limibaculum sp. FT325]|uniref:Bax inhibitor-1/YccA family protein n=1 Tax=Thermohalobaculum sediminis TaxID=2939436 RepID=UPI0020BEB6E1|nr:Bax inhibitor-1/YccA family protein [Limibaculum sediminis]MCL5775772.1 Bax inhibitor-1/YccA family protein [Limibaculum sediminis]